MKDLTSKCTEIEKTLSEIQIKTMQIDSLKQTVTALEQIIFKQNVKMTDLEDRSCRSNLVIHGIPETPNETDDQLKRTVLVELFQNKLGVACSSVARAHRLGKHGSERPIV